MALLRQFLYRDDELISQYLAQLEGGAYDEERIIEQTGSTRGWSGSARAGPASLGGERSRQGSVEAARTVRQTHETRFNRLHSLLDDHEAVQFLEALDDTIWDHLESSEILEVRANLVLARGVKEVEGAGVVGSLGPLVDLLGSLPSSLRPAGVDQDEVNRVREQLPVMQQFASQFADANVPCTYAPRGSPRFKFFAELSRASLLRPLRELEGEVKVLAHIQRFIVRGSPETLGSGLGLFNPTREERRSTKEAQPFTVRVSHPGAVTTVVAIYR